MGLLYSHRDNRVTITNPEKIIHEEKRAPTEKSIELAKEYEELIEKKIAEKLIVQGNIVSFSLAFQQENLFHKLHIKMKINENEFIETFIIDNPCVDYLIDKLRNWICNKIILDPIREICVAYVSGQKNSYTYIGMK